MCNSYKQKAYPYLKCVNLFVVSSECLGSRAIICKRHGDRAMINLRAREYGGGGGGGGSMYLPLPHSPACYARLQLA